MKFLARAIKSLALAVTITYGAIIAPQIHNHYLRSEVGESVVRVLSMTSEGGGTGFAVQGKSGKNYIMTNRHVCEAGMMGIIRVKVGDQKPIFRKIIKADTVHDLCIIEGVKELRPISIGEDQDKGDFMYVVGHPGLRDLTVSHGEYIGRKTIELVFDVEKREQCPGRIMELPPLYQMIFGREFVCLRSFPSLSTSAVIYPGNSGSPVVNKWGHIIGVAFARSNEQERDNYVVPLFYVKKLLEQY